MRHAAARPLAGASPDRARRGRRHRPSAAPRDRSCGWRPRHRRDHLPGRRDLGQCIQRRRQGAGLARGRRGRLLGRPERQHDDAGGRFAGHLHARKRPRYRHRQPHVARARAVLLPPQPLFPPQGRAVLEGMGRGPRRNPAARGQDDHGRRDHLVPALLRRRHDRRCFQRGRRRPCRAPARRPARRDDRGRDLRLRLHPLHRGVLRWRLRRRDRARLGGDDDCAHHARRRDPRQRCPAADRPADRLRSDPGPQPASRPHRHDQRGRPLRDGGTRPRRPAHLGGCPHQRRPRRREGEAEQETDDEPPRGDVGEPDPVPG